MGMSLKNHEARLAKLTRTRPGSRYMNLFNSLGDMDSQSNGKLQQCSRMAGPRTSCHRNRKLGIVTYRHVWNGPQFVAVARNTGAMLAPRRRIPRSSKGAKADERRNG